MTEAAVELSRFDPHDPLSASDPWSLYRPYRLHDPVHWGLPHNPQLPGAWYVFGYDDCKSVLLNPNCPINPQSVGMEENFPEAFRPVADVWERWLGATDEPGHRPLRKLLMQGFSPKSVQALAPRIDELAIEMIETGLARPGGRFDFVAEVAFPLPIVVICELMGVPASDRATFRELSKQFMYAVSRPGDEGAAHDGATATAAFVEYFGQLCNDRRRSPKEDFVGLVIAASDAGEPMQLPDVTLAAVFMELVIGGHETTVNGLAWGLLGMLEQRRPYEQLATDPAGLVDGAVEEVVRWSSPVKRTRNRWVTEGFELGGRTIRRGDAVFPVVASANRDERRFTDPDTIDITRNEGQHLGFGHAAHFCLGGPLARLELAAAFRRLVERAPGLRLTDDARTWRDNLLLPGPRELWLSA